MMIYTTTLEPILAKIAETDEPAASRRKVPACLAEKTFFTILICAYHQKILLKRKRKFFLLGSALNRAGGGFNADEAKQNYFCGRKRILLFPALFCFGAGVPPRRRVREECAAGIWTGAKNFDMLKTNISPMKKEIEATFLSVDKDAVRKKLGASGFVLQTPEYMMRRKTFDFPNISANKKKWGRVRQESDKVTMTVKEVRGSGINDTYEVELIVNDFDTASTFFEACNIPAKASQENMREVWGRDGVEVTIDTWPGLNPFVEIEAETEEVMREVSKELDFDFERAVFGSIDIVYEKELGIPATTIIKLPEITFTNPPKKNAA